MPAAVAIHCLLLHMTFMSVFGAPGGKPEQNGSRTAKKKRSERGAPFAEPHSLAHRWNGYRTGWPGKPFGPIDFRQARASWDNDGQQCLQQIVPILDRHPPFIAGIFRAREMSELRPPDPNADRHLLSLSPGDRNPDGSHTSNTLFARCAMLFITIDKPMAGGVRDRRHP